MKAKLRKLRRHPLVVIPPLVLALLVGWHHYTTASRDLSVASGTNLLASSRAADWQIHTSGKSSHRVTYDGGYASRHSIGLTVRDYRSGDSTITTPKAKLTAGTPYLYKGYYQADAPFALLQRSFAADGSSTLELLRTYPAATDTWTTVSQAFRPARQTVAVQFVYRMYANGHLQVDSPYLERQQHSFITAAADGTNDVPNTSLVSSTYDSPGDWTTYHSGDSTAQFSYQQDGGGDFIETSLSAYKTGQAKWLYQPQPIGPNESYATSVSYRSDKPVTLVAEYALQDGKRQYQTVASLPPAGDWTMARSRLQTPPGAVSVSLSLPLEQAGTVDSRAYSLTRDTRPGPAQWQQPLVSITFDDGWEQAYQTATPLLGRYNYRATYYVNPASIETSGFMTAAQLHAAAQGGNEIAAHGYDHRDLTAISSDQLDYQLGQGRDYLRSAGFTVRNFAPPFDRSDPEVRWYAERYFDTMRGSVQGINTRQGFDPYDLRVLTVTTHTTAQAIATALQQTKASHGWLILSYHQINDTLQTDHALPVEQSVITPAQFAQTIAQIKASGLPVLPIGAAYQALEHTDR